MVVSLSLDQGLLRVLMYVWSRIWGKSAIGSDFKTIGHSNRKTAAKSDTSLAKF